MPQAAELIRAADTIAVAGHLNPDGDCIGSLLALGLGLRTLGKRVWMLSHDEFPPRFRRLPGAGEVRSTTDAEMDLAISVDVSMKQMLGDVRPVFEKSAQIVEIDHHEYRAPFGDVQVVDQDAAAVGELVYLLLDDLGVGLTPEIAQNILTSIVVETLSFRVPQVRPFTFSLCAKLLETGVDFSSLAEMVYWSQGREATVLLGICLSRCSFLQKGKIAWSIVTKEDFERVQGADEDIDPGASEMLAIQGVEVSVLFREKKEGWLRVSMRSKGRVNVAEAAEKFDGGGHFDAAGCVIPNEQSKMDALLGKIRELLIENGG
ncbi:MAG: hypothetical protein GF333_04865 [Candidatus Omnitrophica bacterium]|nr:hypothetical protein [Candidatus Omnitrophota bacterium]